jgi:hypothetical protein
MLSAQVEGDHVSLHELRLPRTCFGIYLMRAALCIDLYRIKLALRRQILGAKQGHCRRAVQV